MGSKGLNPTPEFGVFPIIINNNYVLWPKSSKNQPLYLSNKHSHVYTQTNHHEILLIKICHFTFTSCQCMVQLRFYFIDSGLINTTSEFVNSIFI